MTLILRAQLRTGFEVKAKERAEAVNLLKKTKPPLRMSAGPSKPYFRQNRPPRARGEVVSIGGGQDLLRSQETTRSLEKTMHKARVPPTRHCPPN